MRALHSRRGAELIALAQRHQSGQWHDDMERLDQELVYGPRLATGVMALVLAMTAGALGALGTHAGPGTSAMVLQGVAVAIGVGALWLGCVVIAAGHRVVNTYIAMTPDGGDRKLRHVLPLMWATGGVARPLLTALAALGFAGSIALVSLALRTGDPAGLGERSDALRPLGVIWAVAFAVCTLSLLVGDLRVALALAKGIGQPTRT